MSFLVVVVVFLIVQYWGSGEPLHRDGWWKSWADTISRSFSDSGITLLLQVLLPVVVVWWLLHWLAGVSSFLLMLASVPALLYCLGRGDFSEWVNGYIDAFKRNDNEVAAEYAQRLGVLTEELDGWPDLHRAVLQRVTYRAFERMFVAIFWFVLLGVAGALFYRLAQFARERTENSEEVRLLAARLMWILEWPVVRVLGCSLALTGNFMGAFQSVIDSLWSFDESTELKLERMVHGALNVNGSELVQEGITESEIEALQPLLSRSLVLWLCVLGLIGLF